MSAHDPLTESVPLWWCPSCGVVWAAEEAPLCRHFVIDGPPVRRMEPIPPGHPYADAGLLA